MSIRSMPDVGRLARAVSRPGIDPRTWITLATVIDIAFDAVHGVFVDVQFQPEGTKETCLLGSQYTCDGGGLFCPLAVGDLVLVAVPGGECDHGPTIIAQMWNKTTAPAPEMAGANGEDTTTDIIWRVSKGKKMKVLTTDGEIDITADGAGKIVITSSGSGDIEVTSSTTIKVNAPNVLLGDSPGAPVARQGDLVSVVVPLLTSMGPIPGTPCIPALPTAVTTGGYLAMGTIVTGAVSVKA